MYIGLQQLSTKTSVCSIPQSSWRISRFPDKLLFPTM